MTQAPGSLNAVRRARELSEATDGRVVDLLVVGLGVTGAGPGWRDERNTYACTGSPRTSTPAPEA